MPKRLTTEHYEALAKARGFEWLGPEACNSKDKTRWRCSEGHRWKARYNDIQQGHGCPQCKAFVLSAKLRLEPDDYHALARMQGFEWLGPEVCNSKDKTWWRCRNNHEWNTKYNIIQRGHDCPSCSKETVAGKLRHPPESYRAIALLRGFEWLGPEVPNIATKTKWRCARAHEWMAGYGAIKQGDGCPACNESHGEAAVARCLNRIEVRHERQKRFRQCRGEGGTSLPFDFFFHYHNVAFLVEYDGQQHFELVSFFGGEGGFRYRQSHDVIKTRFAADNGYVLIRIPYTVTEIETYLTEAIARHTGLAFEQVAFPSPQTRPSMNLSESPPVGFQLPLLKSVG